MKILITIAESAKTVLSSRQNFSSLPVAKYKWKLLSHVETLKDVEEWFTIDSKLLKPLPLEPNYTLDLSKVYTKKYRQEYFLDSLTGGNSEDGEEEVLINSFGGVLLNPLYQTYGIMAKLSIKNPNTIVKLIREVNTLVAQTSLIGVARYKDDILDIIFIPATKLPLKLILEEYLGSIKGTKLKAFAFLAPPLVESNSYEKITALVPLDSNPSKVVSTLKRNVCSTLAQETQSSEELVRMQISCWATSSSSFQAIAMKSAIANMFKLPNPRHKKVSKQMELFVTSIYSNTQALLKKAGISKVFLYRGYSSYDSTNMLVSEKTKLQLNHLSSFTDTYSTALQFACDNSFIENEDVDGSYYDMYDDGDSEEEYQTDKSTSLPYIIGGWFPVSSIFSTPFTGPGCHREHEFLVIGGEYELYLDPLTFYLVNKLFPTTFYPKELNFRLTHKEDLLIGNKFLEKVAKEKKMSVATLIDRVKLRGDFSSESSSKIVNIDEKLSNADWTKQSWDLPKYGSKEFFDFLKTSGITLAEFKKLPVYANRNKVN